MTMSVLSRAISKYLLFSHIDEHERKYIFVDARFTAQFEDNEVVMK